MTLSRSGCPSRRTAFSRRDPLLLSASKGACYYTPDGREVVDAAAGLWCVNAGHGRTEIADAVNTILRQSDFIPTFQILPSAGVCGGGEGFEFYA